MWDVAWCNLCMSNDLLMSTATAIVGSGGLFRLKPVAMVLCSGVLVKWLPLKPCCVEGSDMSLYNVQMFMSLLGFGIGLMFASFHM